MTLDYRELHSKLGKSTMIITFYKANGEIRPMLCTRNINTAAINYGYMGNRLSSFSRNCNERNRNIGVIDLIIGDARCFKMDRVVDANDLGEITTPEHFDRAVEIFRNYVEKYKEATAGTGLFDNIEIKTQLSNNRNTEDSQKGNDSVYTEQAYTADEVNNMFSGVVGDTPL